MPSVTGQTRHARSTACRTFPQSSITPSTRPAPQPKDQVKAETLGAPAPGTTPPPRGRGRARVLTSAPDDRGPLVAPDVDIKLRAYTDGESTWLAEVRSALSAAQLAGLSRLPDPLPVVPEIREAAALGDLRSPERRLLLIAAVAVLDSTAMLLAAASVNIEAALSLHDSGYLNLAQGTFRFRETRVRAAVLTDAADVEVADAHRSLAHTLRSMGKPTLATWHAAQSLSSLDGPTSSTLLRIARRLLISGNTVASATVASFITWRSQGSLRTSGAMAWARAALWAGHLDDARRATELVLSGQLPELHRDATLHMQAIEQLQDGPPEHADPMVRVSCQLTELSRIAVTRADRSAFESLLTICQSSQHDDRSLVDWTLAKLRMSVRSTPLASPWFATGEALTPLAEACVRLLQVAHQIAADDRSVAAATLCDATARLPLSLAAGGVAASYHHLLAPFPPPTGDRLRDALESLSPRRHVSHHPEPGTDANAARATHQDPEPRLSGSWRLLLKAREVEVVEQLLEGLTNRQIAQQLGLSPRTIEVHLSRIYRKTGVPSRSALIAGILRQRPHL